MVGSRGFEPPTSSSRTRRANQAALRADGLFLMANLNTSILNIDLRGQIRELVVL